MTSKKTVLFLKDLPDSDEQIDLYFNHINVKNGNDVREYKAEDIFTAAFVIRDIANLQRLKNNVVSIYRFTTSEFDINLASDVINELAEQNDDSRRVNEFLTLIYLLMYKKEVTKEKSNEKFGKEKVLLGIYDLWSDNDIPANLNESIEKMSDQSFKVKFEEVSEWFTKDLPNDGSIQDDGFPFSDGNDDMPFIDDDDLPF